MIPITLIAGIVCELIIGKIHVIYLFSSTSSTCGDYSVATKGQYLKILH